jgi:hypothetical protein
MTRVPISITPWTPDRMPLISAGQAVKAGSWDYTPPLYEKNQRTVPRLVAFHASCVCLIYFSIYIHRCICFWNCLQHIDLVSTDDESSLEYGILSWWNDDPKHMGECTRTQPRMKGPRLVLASLMNSNPIATSSCASTSRQGGRHFNPLYSTALIWQPSDEPGAHLSSDGN